MSEEAMKKPEGLGYAQEWLDVFETLSDQDRNEYRLAATSGESAVKALLADWRENHANPVVRSAAAKFLSQIENPALR